MRLPSFAFSQIALGFTVLLSLSATAQSRYQDSLYAVSMATYTYAEKPSDTLQLDLYTPEGDGESARPLLLYVHGGGFSGGQRNSDGIDRFCRTTAARGYAVATMSYTLVMKGKSFSCDQPAPNKIETFRLTGQDVVRATRFLIDRADTLGIAPSQVVLLGSSAGAEAILHTAYWPATRTIDGQALLPTNFRYAGVISMAGALVSLDWVTADSAIPTQFFHGTCDNLVPYGAAPHHYCDASEPGYMPLYGAEAIAEKLRALGKPYYLYTVCRGRHEWAGEPLSNNVAEIIDFLYHDVLNREQRQIHRITSSEQEACPDYPGFVYCE